VADDDEGIVDVLEIMLDMEGYQFLPPSGEKTF